MTSAHDGPVSGPMALQRTLYEGELLSSRRLSANTAVDSPSATIGNHGQNRSRTKFCATLDKGSTVPSAPRERVSSHIAVKMPHFHSKIPRSSSAQFPRLMSPRSLPQIQLTKKSSDRSLPVADRDVFVASPTTRSSLRLRTEISAPPGGIMQPLQSPKSSSEIRVTKKSSSRFLRVADGDVLPTSPTMRSMLRLRNEDNASLGDIMLDCGSLLLSYQGLLVALEDGLLDQFYRFAGTFSEAVTGRLKETEKMPSEVQDTSIYQSAKKEVELWVSLFESQFGKVRSHLKSQERREILDQGANLLEILCSNLVAFVNVCQVEYQHYLAQRQTGVATGAEDDSCTVDDVKAFMAVGKAVAKSKGAMKKAWMNCLRKFSSSERRRKEKKHNAGNGASQPGTPLSGRSRSGSEESCSSNDDVNPDILVAKLKVSLRSSRLVFDQMDFHLNTVDLPRRIEASQGIVRESNGSVVSATLPQLVWLLTDHVEALDADMPNLLDAFFLFFRRFTTPTELFTALMTRFNEGTPRGIPLDQAASWRRYHMLTKLHVVKMLVHWLQEHWVKREDDILLDRIRQFTFGVVTQDPDLPATSAWLLAIGICICSSNQSVDYPPRLAETINQAEANAKTYPATVFEARHLPLLRKISNLSLIGIKSFTSAGGAEELARALTIMESDLFHSISPLDVVKFKDQACTPERKRWTRFANALTLWTAKCILDHREPDQRAKVLGLFIDVANICKSMRNYSSAYNIYLALKMGCIRRLSKTHELVSDERLAVLDQLGDFFLGRSNFQNYREELLQNLPTVPLANVIKGDVIKIYEANSRKNSSASKELQAGELIELQFYRNVRRTVRDLERCYGKYKIPRMEFVHRWIEHGRLPLERYSYQEYADKLYVQSETLEPSVRSTRKERSAY